MRPKVTIAREQFDAVILHMEGVVIQTAKVQASGDHPDKTLALVTAPKLLFRWPQNGTGVGWAGGPAAPLPSTHRAIPPLQPADR